MQLHLCNTALDKQVCFASISICASPSGEDTILQTGGLTAEPSALVAGRAAAGQGGARGREGGDQQAAQRSCEDRRRRSGGGEEGRGE